MDRVSVFSVLAVVFVILGYWPYYRAIVTSVARPTLSTWVSWLIMDAVILCGMLAKGEVAWQMAAYVAGSSIIIFVCVKRKATLGWKTLDSVCMGLVGVAMLGWYLSGDADVAIICCVLAVVMSSAPMLRNLWKEPRNEPLGAWLFAMLGGTFGVLAIPSLTIAYALMPIVFFVFQLSTIGLICRKFLR